MINYPNSSKFAVEYPRFLVECETDFAEGMKIKSRSELIECGKNYDVEYCFKYQLFNNPECLKKGIVDIKDNLKIKGEKKGASCTNSSKNNMSVLYVGDSDVIHLLRLRCHLRSQRPANKFFQDVQVLRKPSSNVQFEMFKVFLIHVLVCNCCLLSRYSSNTIIIIWLNKLE